MRIERLGKEKDKKLFLYGFIIAILLVILINYLSNRANYRNTESIELAKGTINYSLVDLEIVSITIDGAPSNIMPGDGYALKDTSYCTEKVGDIETPSNTIKLTYENGILNITPYTTKGTKCYLEFYKPTAEDTLTKLFPSYSTAKRGTGFDGTDPSGVMKVTGVDTGNNGNILYEAEDNDGISYFFRGQANNNWVEFANKRWRIIRINGDGTLRLIYQCGSIGCKDTTNTNTQLTTKAYNEAYSDNTYVGYYNQNGTTSKYPDAHQGKTPSTIASYLNDWYRDNLLSKYNQYIDQDAGFCNDRQKVTGVDSSYDGTGAGTSVTSYAAWGRVYKSGITRATTQYPTFKCGVSAATATAQETSVDVNTAAYERDLFTKTGATKGNKLLQYPIGLITVDEVLLAGGFLGTGNSKYYLYTNQFYWTMSPYSYFTSGTASMFAVDSRGYLSNDGVSYTTRGVRPVINLKANITFSGGNGSADTPFVVAT